uniref:Putative ovule protein n=1 Tax=Solanum chacoense TaxID=4108 RepID=A0A0V0H2Z6_SOLCH
MVSKALFGNIRSVMTQKAFDRLIELHYRHHYSYIALLEPFQSPSELETYRRKLGMPNAKVNCAAKIWIFWEEDWEEQDVVDSVQQVTIRFKRRGSNNYFKITAVYARCYALDRLKLWEQLKEIAENSTIPWLEEILTQS